ncbi:MAG: hypothetical protein LBI42_06630 [Chitinispirillales bacterium]|jgi:hypothetical protein|nr:hypothetical protein [Chitinispirillales bacterium]
MKKHAKLITLSLLFALTAILVSCGVQLQAVGGDKAAASTTSRASSAAGGESKVVYKFFDEDFVSGGYSYVYPDASKVEINENEANVKNGEASLQFDLVADDFSGGSVCLYNLLYDLTPYYETGALQIWVKGANGGEKAWIALVDDENTDGKKSVVRLDMSKYGGITDKWTLISVPLADFGKRGVFWDAKARVEVPEPFQWDKVAEFRVEIKKGDNQSFRVWVDDIFIVSNVFEQKDRSDVVYWDDKEYKLPGFPAGLVPQGLKPIGKVLNKGDAVPGGFAYVYGGKTAYKVQETEDQGGSALAMYMDQTEYSGVTMSIGEGRYIDLTRHRTTPSAGLAFWGRGGPGLVNISVGVMDNKGKDVKTQTKLFVGDYGTIDGEWKYYMIPIRMFNENGLYWDASRGAEINSKIDWSKIQEVRISVNRNDERNRHIKPGEPATFYISDVIFIEEIPGFVNPEDYWNAFKSNVPDVMLHQFETDIDQKWNVSHGPKSEASFTYGESGAPDGGGKSLHMTYRLNDWVDFVYNYPENNREAAIRDWTKHWGLKFDFYTDKPYQPITVQVGDKGGELFVAASGGNKGWNEVVVPFRNFTKFPYYQPPDAVQNGKFDLDGVQVLDFKPAGEGSRGTFRIDNVRLTNDRAAKVKEAPANISIKVSGSDKVLTKKINEGIFGINVALWDADLLLPATEKYVRDVNHQVLRYPGGLRADDDDWQDVLKKKDWMVDTDEFFDFMKKTNTGAMITVNFGTGTPEKAAAWVEHAKKKNVNAKYWEIGNELYGSWHPNVTTGDDYGKRAREFAVQMKKADPSIKVTAVWMLDGDWNRETFVHLKDVVDGVNVHHYPQHAGQENDAGLLAAPQTLPDILGSVRRQLKEYGAAGKNYEIWLTEWNSVDFDPGPQTMGIINALFVADYLGMLTQVNIEQASYWDVHNSITPEGGDYGYLSRRGAPDGDNVPRSSYWAFKMASHSLGRGSLLESSTGDDNISSYYTVDGKKKSLMIINKHPKTVADAEINVPGFAGRAKMNQLTTENSGSPGKAGKGPAESSVDVKPGMKLSLPAYSVTTITIE